MIWSGDDTRAGGKETVQVLLSTARQDGIFFSHVTVGLRAVWWQPAGGSGPATLTVSLVNKVTGQKVSSQQQTILPPVGMYCSATRTVGAAVVRVEGSGGFESVSFTLTEQEPGQ